MAEAPMAAPDGHEFHHIGYATTTLDRELVTFGLLGYRSEGKAFTDQVQGVRGLFLVGAGPRIELLESLPGSTTLAPWLANGIRMYHVAYTVPDIGGAVAWARAQRARITVEPVPAVAFQGRRVSFAMFRNGLLVEFIER